MAKVQSALEKEKVTEKGKALERSAFRWAQWWAHGWEKPA